MFEHTYFSGSLFNPVPYLDRWLNGYKHIRSIPFHDNTLTVRWTERAERKRRERDVPLVIEMQLYFSCVVQKRVLFHDSSNLDSTPVEDDFRILFRPVQASSCDPVEFANKHPVKTEFTSAGAKMMRPAELRLDYQSGEWIGEFDT